ncbi:GNAT family N-acetyltransferase [Azospirillum sp. TSO35-2]|uniref:GNAT family N-acetyltransferase n=1 Tax=Azospirillum sp. TSO35-2 TaxID=716796 RepID=UPI000D61ED05|nr:GNAT family N-acetyltransferase [Azospirillum sp. TSO35-2]PWC32470.1 GCN5 family acetyltransferase [Azospirillum sp. TSO35-2]
MPDITIAAESPRQEAVTALIAALDDYLRERYPDDACHLLDVDTLAAPDVRFFVARKGGHPVGCAALRIDPAGYGEVKRMFVSPGVRGGGIARRLLDRLTEQARAEGIGTLMLETGIHQPEAVAMYRKAGFTDRGPYACYADHPLSLFMEKTL